MTNTITAIDTDAVAIAEVTSPDYTGWVTLDSSGLWLDPITPQQAAEIIGDGAHCLTIGGYKRLYRIR